MIRFLLNEEIREIEALPPETTVLDYLRQNAGKTGTKEGCASGDCGACTVVVAEADGDHLRYRTINACLSLLPSVAGKQLITVEDLAPAPDQLHPCQQAMVDHHASQCGFCTPGIVMSLFALGKNNTDVDREQTLTSLAGNLCRCTGYRPIIDAAISYCHANTIDDDHFARRHDDTLNRLHQLAAAPSDKPAIQVGQRQLFHPTSQAALHQLLQRYPKARLVAGATDLALEITQQQRRFETLIHLRGIPALQELKDDGRQLVIGAARPLSDCIAPLVRHFPDIEELLNRFASEQIRNQATLGGNLANASPIGDTAPVLLALDARLTLTSPSGSRQLPLADFFLDYRQTALTAGEYIEAVSIPLPTDKQPSPLKVYKVSKRLEDDIAAVCGAFCLQQQDNRITSARVAFGGMAATPRRARHCEQALLGQPWNLETLKRAQLALHRDFTPLSDARASDDYRRQVADNLLYKYYLEQQQPTQLSRITHYE